MDFTAGVVMSLLSAAVFCWPTWIALILAQVATLLTGVEEFRWLPSGLLLVGFAYACVRPLWH
ncbi:MAG: hypothetical protein KGL35_08825 [Bradyrhizobium sp.]|nr:hypothetical protein [Bradyrhizobium sp.]